MIICNSSPRRLIQIEFYINNFHHLILFLKYNLYVQPINLIQKKELGQTRRGCEVTGNGAARKWRGAKGKWGVHHANCHSPQPLLGRRMCPCLPSLPYISLLWSQRQGSPLTKPLTWPTQVQSISRSSGARVNVLQKSEPPNWGLPPCLAHCVLCHPFWVLGQIGELLLGLREYHPNITLFVGEVLGPWGVGRFPTQDAYMQEVTETVNCAFILRWNSNGPPPLLLLHPPLWVR